MHEHSLFFCPDTLGTLILASLMDVMKCNTDIENHSQQGQMLLRITRNNTAIENHLQMRLCAYRNTTMALCEEVLQLQLRITRNNYCN